MIVIVAAQSSPNYARKYSGATTERTNKQFEEPARDLFRIINHPRHTIRPERVKRSGKNHLILNWSQHLLTKKSLMSPKITRLVDQEEKSNVSTL